jgi:hypothetical protein
MFEYDRALPKPYEDQLNAYLNEPAFKALVNGLVYNVARKIQKAGNKAVHDAKAPSKLEAIEVLSALYQFCFFLAFTYGRGTKPDPKIKYNPQLLTAAQMAAEAATLAIMAGGDIEQFERAVPILSVMGRPTRVGPAGCGQIAKLCNQLIVGATINIVAEAMLLAQAGGADPAAMRTAIRGGFAESRILEVHGQRMLDRNFVPGGQVKTQLKDLENILHAAAAASIRLPVTALVADNFRHLVTTHPTADHSAILIKLEQHNPGQRVGGAANKFS